MILNSVNTSPMLIKHSGLKRKKYQQPILEEITIEAEEVIAFSDLDDGDNDSNPGRSTTKNTYQMSWKNMSFEE